jgi:hypothetical protein
MAISEIPAKIVESAAGLTGKKMEIARDLFKIVYGERIHEMKVEEVIEKYKEVFELMKDVSPPEQATHFLKHHKIAFQIGISFLIFFLIVVLSFVFHKYWDHMVDVLTQAFF